MAIRVTKAVRTRYEASSPEEIRDQVLAIAGEAAPDAGVKVEIALAPGVHRPLSPIVFSVKENPELANISLRIYSRPGTDPIIATMNEVRGTVLSPVLGKPYYTYQYAKNEEGKYPVFHDYFCNGKRLKMAESPIWHNPFSLLPEEKTGEKPLAGLYAPVGIAKKIKEHGIGTTELRLYAKERYFILRVKDVDLTATREANGETFALVTFLEEFDAYFAKEMGNVEMGGCEAYFANNLAYLTETDTYVYDWSVGCVYVVPDTVEHLGDRSFGYAPLSSYFVFEGMKNVTVEGLRFQGLSTSYVCENGYFDGLSHTEARQGRLRQGAIVASNVRDFTISNCFFRFLGTNAVQLCDSVVRGTVENCRFDNIGMSAIAVGKKSVKGENPQSSLFGIRIVNNEIKRVGYEYPTAAAIFLGASDGSLVSRNSVCGCAGFGIFAGHGRSPVDFLRGEDVNLRDCEISYNEIRSFTEVCEDGAAITVTGGNEAKECADCFNTMHHNAVFLEERDRKGGRGYCLDGAASHFHLYDNVAVGCTLSLCAQREGEGQSAYCCMLENFYSDAGIVSAQDAPNGDLVCRNVVSTSSRAELFEKHPEAQAILRDAGYRACYGAGERTKVWL